MQFKSSTNFIVYYNNTFELSIMWLKTYIQDIYKVILLYSTVCQWQRSIKIIFALHDMVEYAVKLYEHNREPYRLFTAEYGNDMIRAKLVEDRSHLLG